MPRGGGVVRRQYDEIKRVLKEADYDWVLEQCSKIKQHAIDHTAFYSNYQPEDTFPVVNKSLLLKHYDAHKADGGFDTPLHYASTSGSTGTPFTVIQNFSKRQRTIADLKVFGELCDYPSHERMLYFRIMSEKFNRTPEIEDRDNIYFIDSSNLGEKRLKEMVQSIVDMNPRMIHSYGSTLVELAKFTDEKWDGGKIFSMRSVLCTGEGLSDENRKFIEKIFGCPVYRRYSDMELGIFGQDSGDGGAYRLNWGSYYFECLKIDSDEPAADGEIGRIVITDLFNHAFPMIRYDTGDLGIMQHPADGSLPYYSEVMGRVRDCVYSTNGTLISPAKFNVMMWGKDAIRQWQFIQESEKQYTLKLNCDKEIDTIPLIEKFKGVLGEDAEITVQFVDEIPVLSSNKRRAVVRNYQKN